MPDRRSSLVRRAAQLRHQRGRRKRAVGHLLTHIDVSTAQTWAGAPEIELTDAPRDVLEVARAGIIGARVDWGAEVHGWLPVEIITRVVAPREPDVYSAKPTGTLTLKEQRSPVA